MEEEILQINELYNTNLKRLTATKDYYFNLINRWRINNRIKQYYLNYITNWYNKELSNLVK